MGWLYSPTSYLIYLNLGSDLLSYARLAITKSRYNEIQYGKFSTITPPQPDHLSFCPYRPSPILWKH